MDRFTSVVRKLDFKSGNLSRSLVAALALLLLGLSVLLAPAYAWVRTFGGPEFEDAHTIAQTTDGGYIIAGTTSPFTGVAQYGRSRKLWLLRLNSEGDTLWTRTYQCYGDSSDAWPCRIIPTPDNGYILLASRRESEFHSPRNWLLKFNEYGDTLWTKSYGDTCYREVYDLAITGDGGYAMGVYWLSSPYTTYSPWICFLRLDAQGDTLWTKKYGCLRCDDDTMAEGWCTGIRYIPGEGYILVGQKPSDSLRRNGTWILRTTEEGDSLWVRYYDFTSTSEAFSLLLLPDGGFIGAGLRTDSTFHDPGYPSRSFSPWVLRLNSVGDTLWTNFNYRRTPAPLEYIDTATGVVAAPDGGFFVTASTANFGHGDRDAWVYKLNSAGDTVWNRFFGGAQFDDAQGLAATTDGGCIVVGRTRSFGAGQDDIYVLKLDSLGRTEPGDVALKEQPSFEIAVSPNPFHTECHLSLPPGSASRITDLAGHEVVRLDRAAQSWKPERGIPAGVYLLRTSMAGTEQVKAIVYLK